MGSKGFDCFLLVMCMLHAFVTCSSNILLINFRLFLVCFICLSLIKNDKFVIELLNYVVN